jgi:hypothetical protein
MASGDLWLLLLGPAGLFGVGTCGHILSRNDALRLNRFAIGAAILALVMAFAAVLRVAYAGTIHTATAGAHGIGFSLYLDDISVAMFCLVSFVGLVVINYSRNYMDGDPRQSAFTRFLCLTLTAILLVIISGNLLQLGLDCHQCRPAQTTDILPGTSGRCYCCTQEIHCQPDQRGLPDRQRHPVIPPIRHPGLHDAVCCC